LIGNSGVKEQYEELLAKHDTLTKSHSAASTSHATDLEQAKQLHAAAVVALDNKESLHQKDLEELKSNHAKNLDEAHDRAMSAGHTAHAEELKQMKTSHDDAIASLKKDHATAQATALSDAQKLKVLSLQAERKHF
jgi:hypothetical protein